MERNERTSVDPHPLAEFEKGVDARRVSRTKGHHQPETGCGPEPPSRGKQARNPLDGAVERSFPALRVVNSLAARVEGDIDRADTRLDKRRAPRRINEGRIGIQVNKEPSRHGARNRRLDLRVKQWFSTGQSEGVGAEIGKIIDTIDEIDTIAAARARCARRVGGTEGAVEITSRRHGERGQNRWKEGRTETGPDSRVQRLESERENTPWCLACQPSQCARVGSPQVFLPSSIKALVIFKIPGLRRLPTMAG